ncbi:MAG: gliding motility-associated C-terminal domain-containing protein, partial [Bacteroidales bacterium]
YEWTGPEGSGLDRYAEDQSAVTAGKYIVEVRDFNGCMITDSITLTEPPAMTVDLSPMDITCESPGMNNGSITSTVQGGEQPYSYSWSNGAGTENISGLTEGRYYLTVTDIYGCQVIDSADIALPPPLEFNKEVSDYNGFNISCYNENDGYIDLSMTSGEEPYVFSWSGPDGFSSTEDSIGRLSAGEYILTVEDENYCTVTDTTIITQPGQLIMGLEISESDYGGFNVNCYGDSTASIEIIPENNVGEVGYNWTDGYSQAERTGLGAGTYGVLIVDENNCSVDTVITLTQPEPVSFTAEIVQPYCKDKPDGEINIEAMGGYVLSDYSYLWFDNSTSSYKDNVAAGEYWLTVTDDNGCSVTDTIIVTSERDNCLTIPNAISPNGDNINDVWNIDLIELYPEAEIRIFNRWGELIWVSEKGYPEPWDGTSNGRRLPIDTYHYIINLHDGTKPAIGDITILR